MWSLLAILLITLWLLGYISFPGQGFLEGFTLFYLGDWSVNLRYILTLGIILWLLTLIPPFFKTILFLIMILWILSVLELVRISHFSTMIILVLVIACLLRFLRIA